MGGRGGVGGGSDNYTALFRAGKATKSSTHTTPRWHHYHIRDFMIAGLAKCPPEKQTSAHWPIETLCMDSPWV